MGTFYMKAVVLIFGIYALSSCAVYGSEYIIGDAVVVDLKPRSDPPTPAPEESATTVKSENFPGDCVTTDGVNGYVSSMRDCYPFLYLHRDGPNSNLELFDMLKEDSGVIRTRSELNNNDLNPMICCAYSPTQVLPDNVPKSEEKPVSFDPSKCHNKNKADEETKVVGGREASPGEFPWIIAMMRMRQNGTRRQFCGGSILDENWIMTAAHCVQGIRTSRLKNLILQIGDHDIYDDSDVPHVDGNVSMILYHREYSSNNLENDIAIMRLAEPLTFADNIKPVCLSRGVPAYDNGDTFADLAGWGKLFEFGPQPRKLHTANMPVHIQKKCAEEYADFPSFFVPKVTDKMVCAGQRKPVRDVCRGDSGGPLSVQRVTQDGHEYTEQIGLASWSVGCGAYPGVYTRVDKYLYWLNRNTQSRS